MDIYDKMEANSLIARLWEPGVEFEPAQAARLVELVPCRQVMPQFNSEAIHRDRQGVLTALTVERGTVVIMQDDDAAEAGAPARIGGYRVGHVAGCMLVSRAEICKGGDLFMLTYNAAAENIEPEAMHLYQIESKKFFGVVPYEEEVWAAWKRPGV